MEDGSWKMGVGRWELEVWSWKFGVGIWELEDGRGKFEEGRINFIRKIIY